MSRVVVALLLASPESVRASQKGPIDVVVEINVVKLLKTVPYERRASPRRTMTWNRIDQVSQHGEEASQSQSADRCGKIRTCP